MSKITGDETDEELITRLRDGESDVTDYIMNKYKNLVRTKAASMYILGADKDDLIQEGMIGLFKAVRDYDAGRDASFKTFADLCISRQMYTAIQASNRKKHAPLNGYISLYSKLGDSEEDKEFSLDQVLENINDNDPESMMIDRENTRDIEKFIENGLSDFEQAVLELHLTGMSYVEIARVLGRDEKSTDNALQRLKNKIRKYVKDIK
ncbi:MULTISPECIES: RNA polymerase sporulation sigma factor SigH [unclassified Butyrivibrio]|uniref:RNA polymerase sporulation sigma factor SigH n=1 Tax=unclassified Butyrivibrio TaxID=2639466 RepID=UPI00042A4853|nr:MULTISPECIES: RNA polymerase sporulation sigma factor SigH [unclassified Butyrivibrio]SEL18038.1 RNA polymerase sporulation-specific sigma factor [Butyrivibrio sp. ob235]